MTVVYEKIYYFYVQVLKKITGILLIAVYALCACNVSLSFHHCGGEFAYLALDDEGHDEKCCDSKKEMSSDCCKSHKVTYSKTDDKTQAYYTLDVKPPIADAILAFGIYTIDADVATGTPDEKVLLRPPPERTGQIPLYILHSVYRI